MSQTVPNVSDGSVAEVWNHLYSALDLATMELDVLSAADRKVGRGN